MTLTPILQDSLPLFDNTDSAISMASEHTCCHPHHEVELRDCQRAENLIIQFPLEKRFVENVLKLLLLLLVCPRLFKIEVEGVEIRVFVEFAPSSVSGLATKLVCGPRGVLLHSDSLGIGLPSSVHSLIFLHDGECHLQAALTSVKTVLDVNVALV